MTKLTTQHLHCRRPESLRYLELLEGWPLSGGGAGGKRARMESLLLALLRYLRLSIVLIGLMQLGVVSTSSTPDLSGSSVQALKQAPVPLLEAARPSQLAILTGNSGAPSRSLKPGSFDFLLFLPVAVPLLPQQSTVERRLSFRAVGAGGSEVIDWRPRVRAPPVLKMV